MFIQLVDRTLRLDNGGIFSTDNRGALRSDNGCILSSENCGNGHLSKFITIKLKKFILTVFVQLVCFYSSLR